MAVYRYINTGWRMSCHSCNGLIEYQDKVTDVRDDVSEQVLIRYCDDCDRKLLQQADTGVAICGGDAFSPDFQPTP